MRNKILTIQGFILLIGFMIQGIFGIIGGGFLSAVIGLGYGFLKKDPAYIRWSTFALLLTAFCIVFFYIRLQSM